MIAGTIPSQFGNIRGLEVLDLDFNILSGSIPESIYSVSSLRQLDLNDNLLTGRINTRIGLLTNLTFLQLHQNLLTGTIPTELGNLVSLGKKKHIVSFVPVLVFIVLSTQYNELHSLFSLVSLSVLGTCRLSLQPPHPFIALTYLVLCHQRYATLSPLKC